MLSGKRQFKRIQFVRFHLYKFLEAASLIYVEKNHNTVINSGC